MAFAVPLLPALAVAGAGVSAAGAISQGNAQASQLRSQSNIQNYQASIAKNNQIIAGQNADYAIEAGQAKGAIQALKGRAVGGAIKAKQAGGGVDVNTGSTVDVQEAQREGSQLDVETVLNNAELAAYGYRSQAANFKADEETKRYSAGASGAAAGDAETAGYLKAGGGLLSAASSLGFKWGGAEAAPFTGELPTTLPQDI